MEQWVWTVIENSEDGIPEPWIVSFRTAEAAMEQVRRNSLQFGDEPIHFLPVGDDFIACSVNPDVSWPIWNITRTELQA